MIGAPAVFAAASDGNVFSVRLRYMLEKSTLPSTSPIGGMITSFTSEVVILPNAAPITNPTARSTTFPLIANCLKSDRIDMVSGPPCALSSSCHIAIEQRSRERFMPRDLRVGGRTLPGDPKAACAYRQPIWPGLRQEGGHLRSCANRDVEGLFASANPAIV